MGVVRASVGGGRVAPEAGSLWVRKVGVPRLVVWWIVGLFVVGGEESLGVEVGLNGKTGSSRVVSAIVVCGMRLRCASHARMRGLRRWRSRVLKGVTGLSSYLVIIFDVDDQKRERHTQSRSLAHRSTFESLDGCSLGLGMKMLSPSRM